MSELKVFDEGDASRARVDTRDFETIRRELDAVGIRFERWEARQPLKPGASQAEILEAYQDSVERLKKERGFKTADVLSMVPDHPDKAAPMLQRIPLRRFVFPREVSQTAVWLASDAAAAINGADLPVDGGYLVT